MTEVNGRLCSQENCHYMPFCIMLKTTKCITQANQQKMKESLQGKVHCSLAARLRGSCLPAGQLGPPEPAQSSVLAAERPPCGHCSSVGGWTRAPMGPRTNPPWGVKLCRTVRGGSTRQLKMTQVTPSRYLSKIVEIKCFSRVPMNVNTETFTCSSGICLENTYIHHLVKGVRSV